MKRIFLLIFCLITTYVFAGLLPAPPVLRDIPVTEQHYLKAIYDNHNVLEITTTAPNNSRIANEGKIISYDNNGNYELWIKTDEDVTDWRQVTDIDIVFTDGAGLAFGEIYASDNLTETSIATQNIWVQCTIFDTNGQSNNTTPDHTNDHTTIDKAGKYMIIVSASVESGGGAAFDGEFEVKKNNGTVDLENVHTDRDLTGGGGDHGSISMNGIADLSVNDTIEVWVRNKTNTTNLTFEDITLTIIQIGG